MGRASHGQGFPWEGLLIGKVSQGQGFYSSHGLVLIPCVVPHDLGGCFLWLLLGWFLIGKVCHWKGFPWEGLPMGRPSHGKAFPWQGLPMARPSHGKGFSLARFLRGKVSIHHMGLSSSHVLFPMTWGVFPLASPGLVSHWKGLSLERLPMGRPSHGKAFPWQGLPMARPPHGKAFPWQGLPMERPSHWQGFSGARFLFITWACPHPMCCSP